ncbi:MAG: BON domain-containing protein [Pseudomonadales bacterium]|nr:BON domain-containing protein [Pseudomonadales bacterium]
MLSTSINHTFRPVGLLLASVLLLGGCSLFMPASEDYGKRSLGVMWDDQMTESRAKRVIREADPSLAEAHFNVTCFNGVALITGQVASEEAKKLAGDSVSKLRHVKLVHNELQVAGPTSMVARTNDTWLTTKVKSSLLVDGEVEGGRIKVVTEDGVVYLMGLVTRDEAEEAVSRARQTYGVQKIVKVFEYIN